MFVTIQDLQSDEPVIETRLWKYP